MRPDSSDMALECPACDSITLEPGTEQRKGEEIWTHYTCECGYECFFTRHEPLMMLQNQAE